MRVTICLLFGLLLSSLGFAQHLQHAAHIMQHVRSHTSEDIQRQAAMEVIGRLIPDELAKHFHIQIDSSLERNTFEIFKEETPSAPVNIRASSGVAATKAFYHYLKYSCGCLVTWEGSQLNLPRPLPAVNVSITAPSSIVYYQNVCTWSYSFTWWRWSQWRRHIDWMALQGITLSLAPFQEDIWTEVYSEYNLTKPQIDNHLSGPGFFAWQRMGNIRGWGGPLTSAFTNFSRALQQRIVHEMRRLGMTLALPSFAGHLPVQFRTLYPHVTFANVSVWNRFPPQYASPLFLDPTEPLFTEIGSRFLQRMVDVYGSDHIYFSDPFNEIDPASPSGKYLSSVASAIYSTMTSVDPAAVWLLQGWMFVKNPFWSARAIRSFLTAVPIGRMLVLDLQSEQFPQYVRTASYAGQPFIWCTLSNFGGTLGMFGSVENVFRGIRETNSNDTFTMIGTGITPEGINQNYALYEFTLEMGWDPRIGSTEQWFDWYATARYQIPMQPDHKVRRAWNIFRTTVYSYDGLELMRGKYTFNRRPSTVLKPWVWYDVDTFNQGLKLLLSFAEEEPNGCNGLCKYDLVDATRQFLQNTADALYLTLIDDYRQRNLGRYRVNAALFLELLSDLDQLLLTNEHFLLGPFLESAKSFGESSLERQKYEYNARIQLTLWGPQGQIVDYANKQWAGMVRDFFRARWSVFLDELAHALATNGTVSDAKIRETIFRTVDLPFATDNKLYHTAAQGDPLQTAQLMYGKWCKLIPGLKTIPTNPAGKRTPSKKRRNRVR